MAGLAAGEFNRHHDVGNQNGMFKVHPTNRSVLLTPTDLAKTRAGFEAENCRPFAAEAIDYMAGAGEVIPVELGTWTLKKAVVEEQLEAPEKLLRTAAHKDNDMGGTQKTVAVDKADDAAVALRHFQGSHAGSAFEAGKTGTRHSSTIPSLNGQRRGEGLC